VTISQIVTRSNWIAIKMGPAFEGTLGGALRLEASSRLALAGCAGAWVAAFQGTLGGALRLEASRWRDEASSRLAGSLL
jgi:hypothetical protein